MTATSTRPARARATSRLADPATPAASPLRLTLTTAAALLVSLGGLHELLADAAWWFVSSLVALAVLGASALVRHYSRRAYLPLVGGALALVVTVTLFFADGTAIFGVVPTFGTFAKFGALLDSGGASIQSQGVPATAIPGILFILAMAAGFLALVLDAVLFLVRMPALTGVPLLAVVAAPGFVNPEFTDAAFFILAGGAWLLIVFSTSSRAQPLVAFSVGAVAVVAGLVLPLALPPVDPDVNASSGLGYTTGLNPIIDLGSDLRRPTAVLALTYTTTSKDRQYLRMATLDDFTSKAWEPTLGSGNRQTQPETIASAPGRADDVPVVKSTTTVKVGNVTGRWLPVPYAPTKVTGLVGSWVWDPETLNVRTLRSNVRGQEYKATTEAAVPTSAQLRAADQVVTPELERYLEVPESLPEIVSTTALAVTAGAATNYDKAVALQSYFRDGEFSYSEDAPVKGDYDGTSAQVIARFLAEKKGYCVHFASAMAAMSRTLGIPARIAVGFTTGALVDGSAGKPEYRVTTDELHAWPELYFAGVGWTRFEPTVGRNNVPEYSDAAIDNPATPGIDESTTSPTPVAPADVAPQRDDAGSVTGSAAKSAANGNVVILSLAALAILAALGIPALARLARRRARLRALAHGGSALDAWDEIRDTALDLGWRITDAETPREFADRLTCDAASPEFAATGPIGGMPVTGEAATAALARLRVAVERESFAGSGSAAATSATPDVRIVRAALRSGVDWRIRVRADLVPASILSRWFEVGARWRRSGAGG